AWVNTPSGGLNLRESASDSAAVLAVIPRLAQVEVMQGGTAWSQVRYNGLAGYVMSGFLSGADPGAYTESVGGENTADGETGKPGMPPATEQPAAEPAAEDVKATDPTLKAVEREMHAWVSPVDSQPVIGLWPECAEQGKPQANMLPGAQVTVLMAGDTWCQIKYFDATGYCLKKHLNFEAP
ncbi:MAG: SH3 domain-containing protein, partial [Clostridia bacterium]|nr:SH3 domain-containing protein [Clostridia bacterium]